MDGAFHERDSCGDLVKSEERDPCNRHDKGDRENGRCVWFSDAVWQPVLALLFWVIIDGSKS